MAERPTSPGGALVPENAHFVGPVFFSGAAEILGEVEGRVQGAGRLVVGPKARVSEGLEVSELVLAGRVEGHVIAVERASLAEGATLRGTLSCPRVRVAEGALLEGPCRIGPVEDEAKSTTESP